MQPVSREDVKQLIKEAEAAGKDVSELREMMEKKGDMPSPRGERKECPSEEGTVVIESTGPAREEDFEWGN
jgi:hypothetical protein